MPNHANVKDKLSDDDDKMPMSPCYRPENMSKDEYLQACNTFQTVTDPIVDHVGSQESSCSAMDVSSPNFKSENDTMLKSDEQQSPQLKSFDKYPQSCHTIQTVTDTNVDPVGSQESSCSAMHVSSPNVSDKQQSSSVKNEIDNNVDSVGLNKSSCSVLNLSSKEESKTVNDLQSSPTFNKKTNCHEILCCFLGPCTNVDPVDSCESSGSLLDVSLETKDLRHDTRTRRIFNTVGHVFKQNTPTSKRTVAYANRVEHSFRDQTMPFSEMCSRTTLKQLKTTFLKRKKINLLPVIHANGKFSFNIEKLQEKPILFESITSPNSKLEIYDSLTGGIHFTDKVNYIFSCLLVPRAKMLDTNGKAHKQLIKAFDQLHTYKKIHTDHRIEQEIVQQDVLILFMVKQFLVEKEVYLNMTWKRIMRLHTRLL